MAALQFSQFVLKIRINVMNLFNTSRVLRKVKIWQGNRHILQAGVLCCKILANLLVNPTVNRRMFAVLGIVVANLKEFCRQCL